MKGLTSNFKYAFKGVLKAYKEGPIIKIISVLAIIGYIIAFILKFTIIKYAIMTLGVGIAIALETMNSALESVVDATKKYNNLTEDAKDMGSGSVLIFGIFSAFVALMLIF